MLYLLYLKFDALEIKSLVGPRFPVDAGLRLSSVRKWVLISGKFIALGDN